MHVRTSRCDCMHKDALFPSVYVQSRPRHVGTRSCLQVCTASENIQGTDPSTQEMAEGQSTDLREAIRLQQAQGTGVPAGLPGTNTVLHAGSCFHQRLPAGMHNRVLKVCDVLFALDVRVVPPVPSTHGLFSCSLQAGSYPMQCRVTEVPSTLSELRR